MNKNKYVIVAIIAIVYLGISITIGATIENNKKYIFFADGNNLKYNKKWSIISNLQLPDKKYNLIKDGTYIGKETIEINKNIFVNNEEISGEFIGYNGNIKYVEYSKEEITDSDYDIIKSLLIENNINVDSKDLPYIKKYAIDLDNDDIEEYIYSVSNNYNSDIGQLFSLVFISINENYVIIEIDKYEDQFKSYLPYLYFLDINNDNLSEIIIKNTYSSQIGQKVKIISLSKKLTDYRIIFEGE